MPIVLSPRDPRGHGPTRTLALCLAYPCKWLMEFSSRVSSVETRSNARPNPIDAKALQAYGLELLVGLDSANINSNKNPKLGNPGDWNGRC